MASYHRYKIILLVKHGGGSIKQSWVAPNLLKPAFRQLKMMEILPSSMIIRCFEAKAYLKRE